MLDLKSSFFWHWETWPAAKTTLCDVFLLVLAENSHLLAFPSLGLLVLSLPWRGHPSGLSHAGTHWCSHWGIGSTLPIPPVPQAWRGGFSLSAVLSQPVPSLSPSCTGSCPSASTLARHLACQAAHRSLSRTQAELLSPFSAVTGVTGARHPLAGRLGRREHAHSDIFGVKLVAK